VTSFLNLRRGKNIGGGEGGLWGRGRGGWGEWGGGGGEGGVAGVVGGVGCRWVNTGEKRTGRRHARGKKRARKHRGGDYEKNGRSPVPARRAREELGRQSGMQKTNTSCTKKQLRRGNREFLRLHRLNTGKPDARNE